ncbi:MAG: rhodanese-like domain-containing protein [bacterium]|nr:rhodanese-like domain-containing protein [bacterium]
MKNLYFILGLGGVLICGCASRSVSSKESKNEDSTFIAQSTNVSGKAKLEIIEGQKYQDILGEQLKEMLVKNESFVLVDVRPVEDYNKSHIVKAINIPLSDLKSKAGNIGCKCKKVVVYSETTEESAKAAEELVQIGYRSMLNLWGGFDAWQREKGEIVGPITE